MVDRHTNKSTIIVGRKINVDMIHGSRLYFEKNQAKIPWFKKKKSLLKTTIPRTVNINFFLFQRILYLTNAIADWII